MKILILGGTGFIGRHTVAALLAHGHTVTSASRARTESDLPDEVERLQADRDDGAAGLVRLRDRSWDMCIDISGYHALHVRSSIEALRGNLGHYVFISAMATYGNPPSGPLTESHPVLEPAPEDVSEITLETYGALKVTCERIVREAFPENHTILRPQVVAGPYDGSDRLAYWVRQASRERETLAPGDGTDHVQLIDVRDVADFLRKVCESSLAGTFNLAGPRVTWRELITMLGTRQPVWVPASLIREAGLTFRDLPLYRPEGGFLSALMYASSALAQQHGLVLRDLRQTIADTRAWMGDRETSGFLSEERERELIHAARDRT
ncbi:MAG: NAD-dependent epimerase/dehydratase family protein [Candidatus Eisenbacteria bacterium]|uniref:UDP-glucose 4-epimerase n=1 Tax=Eiseniibacteriota bacterium TaxID=2212470 RepID=A0A956LXP6_UNCEI|nr:NAD-dependent epimerase/dehydratase family protein [Candidatus Eisenbacteria bacterium]